MNIKNYPRLSEIGEELIRLAVTENARAGPPPVLRASCVAGRDRTKVCWPGLGEFWLSGPQARVLRELVDAILYSADPDVSQAHLVRKSGTRATRLAEVFAGSPAWGTLVVPGRSPGTYRVPSPPPRGGPDDAA